MASYTESESSTLDFNFTSQSIYEENESSTLDIELAKTTARATYDAVIENRDVERSATFDGIIKNFDQERSLTIDTSVVQQNDLTLTADTAIADQDQDITFSADAVIEEKDTRSLDIDTVIVNQFEDTYTTDAVISKELDVSGTYDAAIQEQDVDVSASMDAAIQEQDTDVSFTTDAVLVDQVDKTATFDTVIAFGKEGSFTAVIDGQSYIGVMNVEIETQLNELHTFKFDAFIEDDQDRQKVQEGNDVLLFDGTRLIFKGELEEVNYDSTFQAECEGSGQKLSLLKKKTGRKEYINQRADLIIQDLLGDNDDIVLDTVEQAPVITIRVDYDNELRAAAGVANAVGYDLYAENRITDDYDTTFVNFVEHKGSESSVATLNIAEELRLVDRGRDKTAVANDITILGRGDGVNQLEARLFAATTKRTFTTQRIQSGDTTTLGVKDATQLGSIGDEVYVRVGEEVVHADIQDSTTLDILGRGQQDYKGDSTLDGQHYEDIQVFLKENVTQSIGPFKPNEDDAEAGSSIAEFGVIEERDADKTLIDRATVEKVCDNELKDRRQPVFRVEVELTDPRGLDDLGVEIGDQVTIEDLTGPDVSNDFRVVGIDYKRASSGEETVLHCANRPVRLIERLSKIERDRDTLNTHMQGATNFNGETFEDNCDQNHSLSNKVFVPEDVVEVNKFELTFTRESFRGYVQNSSHSHDVEVTHPEHSHSIDEGDFEHEHNIPNLEISSGENTDRDGGSTVVDDSGIGGGFTLSVDTTWTDVITGINPDPAEEDTQGMDIWVYFHQDFATSSTSNNYFRIRVTNEFTGDHFPSPVGVRVPIVEKQVADDQAAAGPVCIHIPENTAFENYKIEAELDNNGESWNEEHVYTVYDEHDHPIGGKTVDGDTSGIAQGGTTPTSSTALGSTTSETSSDAGSPNYGIFEPGSEPDIDVEVKVDGNTVDTITDVSVGDEVSTPIDLKDSLSDPVAGKYHRIELVPTDRCRLSADVVQKVFIESKL